MPQKKLLIAANLILLAILAALMVHEKYPERIYKRIVGSASTYKYTDNLLFQQYTALAALYQQPMAVAILGDSYVGIVSWPELLGRCDVAARGISNDLTSGILARVPEILALQPKFCFVQGGVNDISMGVPAAEIIANFSRVADQLLAQGVRPVLHSINQLADFAPGAAKFNPRIREVNEKIMALAKAKNILYIDLDARLSAGGFMKAAFAQPDGMHLNSRGYLAWKEEIEAILATYAPARKPNDSGSALPRSDKQAP